MNKDKYLKKRVEGLNKLKKLLIEREEIAQKIKKARNELDAWDRYLIKEYKE